MANTININIRNCCNPCGTTGAGETPWTITDPNEWPDPSGNEGPPAGFIEAGDITDRQCKTAVFLYEFIYWILDALVNTNIGTGIVNFLNSAAPSIIGGYIITTLSVVAGAALSSVATAGPDISDFITAPLGGVFAGVMATYFVAAFRNYNITLPLLEDILTKMPTYRDRIICEMAQATDYSQVYTRLETVLDDEMGMTDGQRAIFFATIPPQVLQLLYWSAEWWPSFETETLPSITETCCGTLDPGGQLLPGTDIRCAAANYVVDKFLETLVITADFIQTYWPGLFDIWLDMESAVLDHIQEDLQLPAKVTATAFSVNQFQRYLAKYITALAVDAMTSINPFDTLQNDPTFDDMIEYFNTNREDIICGLYTALNAGAASTVFDDAIAAYLATTGLDADRIVYVQTALDGIISGEGAFVGLLFTQDSDILSWPTTTVCDGCGWVDPGDEWTYDDVNDWWYIYGNCSSDTPVGNEQEGDGEPDEIIAGPYTAHYHQVEFSGRTINADALLQVNWGSASGGRGNWYMKIKVDGNWVQIGNASYSSRSMGWEQRSIPADYVGGTLTGVRFGFSLQQYGHSFKVDGWRCRNVGGV